MSESCYCGYVSFATSDQSERIVAGEIHSQRRCIGLDAEVFALRSSLAAAEREVERFKSQAQAMGEIAMQTEARRDAAERARDEAERLRGIEEAHRVAEEGNVDRLAKERAALLRERDEAVEAMKDVLALANTRGSVMEMLAAFVRIEARARAVLEGGK